MTKNRSYLTVHPWREAGAKETKTGALWTKEPERVESGKVDKHGDKFINNEILDSYVPLEKTSDGPTGDYIKSSEIEMLMDDPIKTIVEDSTWGIVTGIIEETIANVFTIGCDEWKERNETPIKNMVGRAFIDVLEQGRLEPILACEVDKLARSASFMEPWCKAS